MTRKEVITRALRREITWIAAAEILGLSARQIRRIKARYEKYGVEGFVDHRRHKPSHRKIPAPIHEQVLRLYREEYFDFSVMHFHEKLIKDHKIKVSYQWTKDALQKAGLVIKQIKKNQHRMKRERRPLPGMMLHLDASTHHWFGENYAACDLLVTLDDATSEVYAAAFFEQEGAHSVMHVLKETISKNGIFCSLYTDRATHFVVTMKAGEKPDRSRKTHVSKALDQLGIELIHAFSPQARGRSERLWRTYQGRLPQELRREKITTIEAANRYLKEVFVPWHNSTLLVPAREQGTAFVGLTPGIDLNRIFSFQYERLVNNDNTVNFKTMSLQLPRSALRYSFAQCRVIVCQHLDASLSVYYGHHLLGHYDKNGILISDANTPITNVMAA
ncbi:MAG: ISNCY family transposase [Bdellovibrionota bacterium]